MTVHTIQTQSKKKISFDSEKPAGSGARKDVFFTPDRSHVVAFYRKPLRPEGRQRLNSIVGQYRKAIFENEEGEYWKKILCWVTDIVEFEGKTGIVLPAYRKQFIFEYGSFKNDLLSIKGTEKKGLWFASAMHQQKSLDKRECGDWKKYLEICLSISRGVCRLHASGLAHSDLSYNNVLVDPITGGAHIIDIDELVVPGKFPPEVVGTSGFIAPEVIATNHFSSHDPRRKTPSIRTDLHALAVLIYTHLFYRHPLKGGKCHDKGDPNKDEALLMGEKALFIEHPTDRSNRPNMQLVNPNYLPWINVDEIPHTVAGPYLEPLFLRAFVESLHEPHLRPTADAWKRALVKTMDLLLPCQSQNCRQKWFVFNNTVVTKCPFCGSFYEDVFPVLDFYSKKTKASSFVSDETRLAVCNDRKLFPWHVDKNLKQPELLSKNKANPVGQFTCKIGKWFLDNRNLPEMYEIDNSSRERKPVPVNSSIELKDGQLILFCSNGSERLARIQMTGGLK